MKIKSIKKFTSHSKKLSFGGGEEQEYLSSHSVFNAEGWLLEEWKSEEESGKEHHRFEYNPQGQLLLHLMEMTDDGISETMQYTRDERGRIVSERKFYGDDPGEEIVFTYLEHDQPVKIQKSDADGEFESLEILTYDERQRLVEHTRLDIDQQPEEVTKIVYSDAGLPVEKNVFDSEGRPVSSIAIAYNEGGDVVRITERNETGKIVSDIVSVYDERRNVIERRIRDFHSRTVRFKYDEQDRCTEEEVLDEHGNLTRKNSFEYDENNQLIGESSFYPDSMRGGNFSDSHSRYEYEYWGDEG